ncbi:MAG: helix-turn-helix transcriptional regulator [Candidatus Gastranaerophilaceae bacterium]|nr:helix-turn-helix transcriptional regulator [Candidatus Gastranaerophilaceae bacterium]
MNIKKDFGLRLKEIRSKKGITQYQLAEICNIDPKHISHIETGRSFPKADLIEKFTKALNIEYTELFRTEHLQSREIIVKKIIEIIDKLDDKNLQNVYKVILSLIN